jgi:hypothetical protein
MSKPKNMTPEQEAAWKENIRLKNRERNKKYRQKNKEKILVRQREWNREKQSERHLTRNKDEMKKYRKKWADKNNKIIRENLSNSYVAYSLRMKVLEVPPELLELKREQLRLTRLTRELKKESQNV